ncbi:MAG: hypothetical protein M3301_01455 [Chloroflexota bacterium]|nr:hypothetical protein [Chloroflexota bacterium]
MLRHTYASLQLANGVNLVQVSRALALHSAAFTLDTYVHLLDGEEAPALDLAEALESARWGQPGGQRTPSRPVEQGRARAGRCTA